MSSSASSHSHSLPHSRSGSIGGLGSMMIEPSSSSTFQPQSYHEYNPSSLQMDHHSHVEREDLPHHPGGTLPPSAMNFSNNTSNASAIVPSHHQGREESSPSRQPSHHQLRDRSSTNRSLPPRGATRGAGSHQAQLAIDDKEGLIIPCVLLEEAANQRAMGKEAEKDKAKMVFADFW